MQAEYIVHHTILSIKMVLSFNLQDEMEKLFQDRTKTVTSKSIKANLGLACVSIVGTMLVYSWGIASLK
jgi:hypothetical protein